eukprot:TRINITY_DN2740_c0_g1_i1.p1 TRINITY_DN2740_c0_g1~~TRINITY_DN2740_c0_g1_i1.p1  ORF type:complete len:638 (-),score=111.42 TRINITY_DN2740_c0_g1_i1:97-1983(-)
MLQRAREAQHERHEVTEAQEERSWTKLLHPVQELADAWSVDITAELHEYLCDIGALQESEQINFMEAAVLVQNSAQMWGRRVEALYNLVLAIVHRVYEQQREKLASAAAAAASSAPPGGRVVPFAEVRGSAAELLRNAKRGTLHTKLDPTSGAASAPSQLWTEMVPFESTTGRNYRLQVGETDDDFCLYVHTLSRSVRVRPPAPRSPAAPIASAPTTPMGTSVDVSAIPAVTSYIEPDEEAEIRDLLPEMEAPQFAPPVPEQPTEIVADDASSVGDFIGGDVDMPDAYSDTEVEPPARPRATEATAPSLADPWKQCLGDPNDTRGNHQQPFEVSIHHKVAKAPPALPKVQSLFNEDLPLTENDYLAHVEGDSVVRAPVGFERLWQAQVMSLRHRAVAPGLAPGTPPAEEVQRRVSFIIPGEVPPQVVGQEAGAPDPGQEPEFCDVPTYFDAGLLDDDDDEAPGEIGPYNTIREQLTALEEFGRPSRAPRDSFIEMVYTQERWLEQCQATAGKNQPAGDDEEMVHRLADWNETLKRALEKQERIPPFEIDTYTERITSKLKPRQVRKFSELLPDESHSPTSEAARTFLACLQLANTGVLFLHHDRSLADAEHPLRIELRTHRASLPGRV